VTTSNTYNFISTTNQQFVDECYERAGIVPDVITARHVQTAIRSGNLVLTEWINKGYNLFTSTRVFISLNPNQANYNLDARVSDVIDCNTRTFSRPLGGTAFSSNGGNADNVFGGTGDCVQNAPNGYISYNYGSGNSYMVTMVGVSTPFNAEYSLVFEYSNDGLIWTSTNTPFVPQADPAPVFYTASVPQWFDIATPVTAQYFRIRETGGQTLDIEQIWFATNVVDIPMARVSGSNYMSYPNKSTQASRPNCFWVDRQPQNPVLVLWPAPTAQYQVLSARVIRMLQDVGSLTDTLEIPARFYDAYCAAVAKRIHMKSEKLDELRIALLEKQEKEAYSYAATEDTEKVPLLIAPSYLTGWGRV